MALDVDGTGCRVTDDNGQLWVITDLAPGEMVINPVWFKWSGPGFLIHGGRMQIQSWPSFLAEQTKLGFSIRDIAARIAV